VKLRIIWAVPAIFVVLCAHCLAQAPVNYVISLENPARHLARVRMEIPAGPDSHELQLPVWNALYQVRDFSQYMNWIRAADMNGKPLPLEQLNKSRWHIAGSASGARIEYEVFTDDGFPFGSQLSPRHAFFNLAEILLYADDKRNGPIELGFQNIPQGWRVATTLETGANVYRADNYDRLVDSPIEIGTFDEADFSGTCGQYRVVVDSNDGATILNKIVPPIERIVAAATNWMDDCPFKTYLFIYHISDSDGSGGMEHAYSTAINLTPTDLASDFNSFAGVTAHEFFHLWNVKRIRPQSLEPVDYTKENYTDALWFSEGVDTTAGNYILLQAGLLDERSFLENLGKAITELQGRPAHRTQSAEQSSMDAWLEKYPYYGLPGRSISYYNKGYLLGIVLDLAMRDASEDKASLRDLFRWMNEHYAKQRKFFADSEGVRQAAEEISRAGLKDFFEKFVIGVEEIPWDCVFHSVGLRVVGSEITVSDPGFQAVQRFDQPVIVAQVTPGSDAENAGLQPEDEVSQINGKPAGKKFAEEIASLTPRSMLHLVIKRGGSEYRLQWRLGTRSITSYRLMDLPKVTPQQRARRASWLFGNGARQ
jgi:predicted metalloprotease with PDZ domain